MPTRLLRALMFCAVLSLALTNAFGQNPKDWIGPYPGYWNTAANWSPSGVPGLNDDVVIYHPFGDIVTLNSGTATINSLTVGSTYLYGVSSWLGGDGSTNLSIMGSLVVGQTGTLELQAGDVINHYGHPFSNLGYVHVGPGAQLNIGDSQIDTVYDGAIFKVEGTLTQNYFVQLATIQSAGTVALMNGQTWLIDGAQNGGTLTNSGQLGLSNGTTLYVNGNVVNTGTLATGGGNSYLGIFGSLTNNRSPFGGTFEVGSNDTADVIWLTNNSDVVVNTGGTLNLIFASQPGIVDIPANSSFAIFGTFNQTYDPSTPSAFFNLTSIEGSLLLSNGQTADVTPVGGTLTISSTGFLEIANGTNYILHGNLSNNQGGISINDPGPTTLTITGTFTNLGGYINVFGPDAVFNAGSIVSGGMLSLPGGSTVTVANGFYQLDAGTLGESIGAGGFGILVATDGQMMLAGTLDIMLDPGFNPTIGSTYQFILFQPGELSGMFASIQNLYFNNGTEKWIVNYNNAGGYVELQAAPAPEPASFLLLGSGLLSAAFGIRRKFAQLNAKR